MKRFYCTYCGSFFTNDKDDICPKCENRGIDSGVAPDHVFPQEEEIRIMEEKRRRRAAEIEEDWSYTPLTVPQQSSFTQRARRVAAVTAAVIVSAAVIGTAAFPGQGSQTQPAAPTAVPTETPSPTHQAPRKIGTAPEGMNELNGIFGDGETAAGIRQTEAQQTSARTESQTRSRTEYHINDTWTVPGQWSLTITGVNETADRNPYSDRIPAAVYVVDFTYTNIGYEKSGWDGLYFTIDDIIVDNAGYMGYGYPGDQIYYAQETPVGATCIAQEVIGVDHSGTFELTVTKYDGRSARQSAVFVIDVT